MFIFFAPFSAILSCFRYGVRSTHTADNRGRKTFDFGIYAGALCVDRTTATLDWVLRLNYRVGTLPLISEGPHPKWGAAVARAANII
eukprot:3771222-Rhodomonas_salina.2